MSRPIMIPTLIGYGNNPDTGYRTPIMAFKDLDPYGERYSAWKSWLRSTKKPRKRKKNTQ